MLCNACSSSKRTKRFEAPAIGNTLTHNYTDNVYAQSGQYAPTVRYTEVSYSMEDDTIWMDIAISTGENEGQLSGEVDIIVDGYDLAYIGQPNAKLYDEKLQIEPTDIGFDPMRLLLRRGRRPGLRAMPMRQNIPRRRSTSGRNVKEKLYWNVISIYLEKDDYRLLSASPTLEIILSTDISKIYIEPATEQLREVRAFMRKFVRQRRK